MKNILKLNGTNTLPNTLSNMLNNSSPFQGVESSSATFTAGENGSIPGLRFLKMYDEENTEISRIQYGFSTSGQQSLRTIPIESAPVVQVATCGAYDTDAALSVGVLSSTATLGGIIQNFADTEVANNFSYVTSSKDLAPPKTSTVESGLAVDVGAGYIRYYDASTDDDIFVMGNSQVSGAVTTDTLYTHESVVQGSNMSPVRNTSFATIALNSTKTVNSIQSANVFQLNFNNAGSTMSSNTYWVRASGYNGDTLKVGSNANGYYVQFKLDGAVIAALQFGTNPSGVTSFTQTLPVALEDENFAVNCVGPFGQRYSTVAYARTSTSFTARNYNAGGASSASCDWSIWWVKI